MSMNHSAFTQLGTMGFALDSGGAVNASGATDPRTTTPPATPPPPAPASTFVKWALAMAALWFVLTALYEYGGGASELSPYLAGLILFGVLFYRGPKALANLQGAI